MRSNPGLCAGAGPGMGEDGRGSRSLKEKTMAVAKKSSVSRLFSLFVAFLGCVVSVVPILYNVGEPVPLILMGSGVTVLALGMFLFFSI